MVDSIKKIFILVTILLLSCFSYSQEHIKLRIDEGEFDNIDVYSIINDKSGNTIIATSNGLFKYNGIHLKKLSFNHSNINSLFGLIEDNNGSIFFYNLNGNVFKLINDSIINYCSIPDTCLANNLTIAFDDANNLVFCSKNYYTFKNNKFKKIANNNSYAREIIKLSDNYLVLYEPYKNELLFYKENELIKKKINLNNAKINLHYLNFFKINNQLFLAALYDKSQVLLKVDTTLKSSLRIIKKFDENRTLLSIVSNKNGDFSSVVDGFSYFVHFKDSLKQLYYSDYRISRLYFDNYDNLWIGTFGKGLYKVPSLKSIKIKFQNDLSAIVKDTKNSIIVATDNGDIFKIEGNSKSKIYSHTAEVDNLIGVSNKLFFNNKFLLDLTEFKLKVLENIPHINDYAKYKDGKIYLATSSGIYMLDTNNYDLTCLIDENRYNSVFVKNDSMLIVTKGEQLELYKIKNNLIEKRSTKKINLPFNFLNTNSVSFYSENNILYKVNENNDTITLLKLLKPITGLVKLNNTLIGIQTNNQLLIYDININKIKNIFKLFNKSDKINKIITVDNYVAFISGSQLYMVSLNDLINKKNKIILDNITDTLKINNKKISIKSNANRICTILLNSGKHNIDVFFKKLPHENHEEWRYEYLVEDYSDNWKNVNENKISLFAENHGEYIIKYRAKNIAGITSPINTLKIIIKKPLYLEWWFIVLVILICFLIIAFIYYNKLKNINKKLTLENRVKTSEIIAIKAQMNPHFVFNTLNSVQDLIFLKDKRSTNIYLGKFADLMRKILDNSEKLEIPLNEEIEILKLYIDLEELRFENEIEIDFKVDVPDNKMDIKVPSMLIQPLIENSFKHGLFHKSGNKKLYIHFYIENNTLICKIEDNGIGRNRALQIQKNQSLYKNSFSTKANEKRISLINDLLHSKIKVEYIDKPDDSGTIVIVKIPF
jgi:hypothetical protein